jgi:zinc protease
MGLRVLVVENHKLPIFTYYTYIEVGGKHETKGITGASHFLEHMMFKGAKNMAMECLIS